MCVPLPLSVYAVMAVDIGVDIVGDIGVDRGVRLLKPCIPYYP